MGSSFFPELTPNQIFVNVVYPGASPEEMEEGVTIKIEEAVRGINDIDEIQSVSSENSAIITIIAYQGSDMENMLAEVKNAVDGINSFPVGAEKPIVFKQKSHPMSERAAFISIIGDVDNFTLKQYADEFEDKLLSTNEISQVLNQARNQSFSDFVNRYRVKEFKRQMEEGAFEKYTLVAIAQKSGFNSKTSFYRIFKNETGKTPADYLKELNSQDRSKTTK